MANEAPIGSSDPNGLIKQRSTSRDTQKVATEGPDQQITTQSTIPSNFLVEAAARQGLNPTADRTADWYRDGDPERQSLSRFIEPFDDETASIRIVTNPDAARPEDIIPRYTKFILQSVSEGHQERSQIVETFGDFYTFFFGERPPMYQFQGTLINTRNASWVSDFMLNYEFFLRGTRCVEQQAQAIVTYGGRQVQGYIMGVNNQTQAVAQEGVGFGFQMVVTKKRFLGFSDDAGLIASDGRSSATNQTIAAIINAIAGPTGTGSSKADTSQAYNVAKDVVGKGDPSAGVNDLGNLQTE